MTNEYDFFTSRADKSQIVHYYNSRFNVTGDKSFYSPDMAVKLPEHWHEDLEFLLVTEGTLYYSVNGNPITLNAGDCIFVNSKRIHSNTSPLGTYTVFYYSLIHPSAFAISPFLEQKFVNPLLGPNSIDYMILTKEAWALEIIDELIKVFSENTSETRELRITETCIRFLRLWYENHKPEEPGAYATSTYVDTFKAMVTYISDNYPEKISLEDIAGAGNVGKTLCAKIFKQFTTKNPGEYLINYRIDKSMDLLKGSNLSITEIAYQTGFNSASHYTKTFREMTGCTPNHFRRGN